MPKKTYLASFEEAREFARSLNLKGIAEWKEWAKSVERPKNISANPDLYYKNKGWNGWVDFLGNEYLSFEEAREFARSLNLKGIAEWQEWAKSGKRPQNIPMTPHWVYKNKGWKDWGDFLGNGNIAKFKMEFLSFEKARDFAHSLNLKGVEEWYTFAKSGKRPQNIPANPYMAYNGKGWTNWKDFLGVSDVSTRFLSFEEVRNFAYSLKLKSQKEWQEWATSEKRPHNIPCNPYQSYKDKGWTNWKDFLGTTISKVVELEECLELH